MRRGVQGAAWLGSGAKAVLGTLIPPPADASRAGGIGFAGWVDGMSGALGTDPDEVAAGGLGQAPATVGVALEAVVVATQGTEVLGAGQSAVLPVEGVVEVGGEGETAAAGEAAVPVAGADVPVELAAGVATQCVEAGQRGALLRWSRPERGEGLLGVMDQGGLGLEVVGGVEGVEGLGGAGELDDLAAVPSAGATTAAG